jgi:thioesterase domain-containing protein
MIAYQPEGPYYIGGYSHGGRVALEMALQLEASGKAVAFLGIIDTWPQHIQQRSWRYLARWVRNICLFGYDDAWQGHVDRMHRGRHRAGRLLQRSLSRLTPWAKPAGGSEAGDVDVRDRMNIDEYPESVQRVIALNFAAFCRYRPRTRCGPLTLFRAGIQPVFGPHQPDLGWGDVSRGPVKVRHLRGSHSNIVQKPRVEELAAELLAALEEAQAQAGISGRESAQPHGAGPFDRAGAPDPSVPDAQPVRAATQQMSPGHTRP